MFIERSRKISLKSDIDLKQVKEPLCLFGGRSFQPAEMALTKVLREEHSWHI